MKKKLICTLMTLVLCAGLLATGALAAGGVTLSAAGAEGAPGKTVDVVVSLAENPGIGALNLSVSYDSGVLEPVSYTVSGLGGMSDSSTEAGTVTWGNTQNTTYTGAFLTLSYKIKDTAAAGATAAVSVSGTADANTDDGEEVSVDLTGASATVTVKAPEAAPCAHGETEIQNKKDATCAAEGYTGDKVCKLCNTTLETGTVIPKTAHTWNEGSVTTEATCTEDGEKTVTCTVCGAEETQAIPAKGHTWDEGKVTKEATCTEDGERTVTCKVCGATDTAVIPAGHVWDEGKVTKEATAAEKGEKLYTCTVCGATKTEEIPALGTGSGAGGGANSTGKTSPQTGDESAGGLWFLLALACVAAGAVIAAKKPRED